MIQKVHSAAVFPVKTDIDRVKGSLPRDAAVILEIDTACRGDKLSRHLHIGILSFTVHSEQTYNRHRDNG